MFTVKYYSLIAAYVWIITDIYMSYEFHIKVYREHNDAFYMGMCHGHFIVITCKYEPNRAKC